jgi:transketolase
MTTTTNHRPPVTFADLPRLMSLMTGDAKHDQAATSTLDVLWVLYDRVLRVTPQTAGDDARDRFVLSKGHGPMAYYAVLAAKGFLDPADLPGFGGFDSILGTHPDRVLVPGVEVSSGSLGHGLPLAVGMALGLRARGLADARVFVLTGDAELDEGSNHEAIAFARAAGLDTLHVVVVDNASSTHGWPGGVEARFAVEGWSVARVSGRDHDALEAAFTVPHPGRPHMVAAVVEPKYSHPAATPTAAAAPLSATTPLAAAEAPPAAATAAPTR